MFAASTGALAASHAKGDKGGDMKKDEMKKDDKKGDKGAKK